MMELDEYRQWRDMRLQECAPILLTAKEAMEILGVGKNTIYRLLKKQQLKGVRFGRSWRIPLDTIQEFAGYI